MVSQQTQNSFPEMLDLSGVPLKMIKVKAGRFQMGSTEYELGRYDDEKQHWVTLTQDYWLGKTPVTQGQWNAIMGNNPSWFQKGDDYPVEYVSWDNAMEFCDKLNEKYDGSLPSGYQFSLPTEAQWEYACRAGTTTALNSGKHITTKEWQCSNLDEVGWYGENSGYSTHPVGQKKPNSWGFHDMHGNVWEWCRDWYGSYDGVETAPTEESSSGLLSVLRLGHCRVYRGGGWDSIARDCRAANRCGDSPAIRDYGLGFRLALVPVQ